MPHKKGLSETPEEAQLIQSWIKIHDQKYLQDEADLVYHIDKVAKCKKSGLKKALAICIAISAVICWANDQYPIINVIALCLTITALVGSFAYLIGDTKVNSLVKATVSTFLSDWKELKKIDFADRQWTLGQMAGKVRELQRLDGDESEIRTLRYRFKNLHAVFVRFGLARGEWNEYFQVQPDDGITRLKQSH